MVMRGLALAFSLLVLCVTSGDIGHGFAGGARHGLETTNVTVDGGPAQQNPSDPTSSHVATDCPVCRVGRASGTALSSGITCFAPVGERSTAAFFPETSAPSSPNGRANAARAPPARLSA